MTTGCDIGWQNFACVALKSELPGSLAYTEFRGVHMGHQA